MKTPGSLLPQFVGASLLLATAAAPAQTLLESMHPVQWKTIIFVSTKMPRESLLSLARQAQQVRATLVLNGFEAGHVGIGEAQQWVGQVNRDCCGPSGGAAFEIDPKKFQQYAIKSVPTFVLTPFDAALPEQWTKVSGDMDLGNAFKFFASQSQLKGAQQYAIFQYKQL